MCCARGNWNPDGEPEHDRTRNVLAARGYYQAFQSVKASIGKVLAKANAGLVVKRDHHDWYAELFGPSVTAGIVEASQLAGYRRGPVFIRNSMHTLLASGGYPWTVIRMSRRDQYMKALEAASVRGQITPLAEFIAQEMREWVPDRTEKS